MWPRVIEFMLACWIAMSPFIFRYPFNANFFWYTDLCCAGLVAFFALISLYHPLRKMHLCNIGVGLYLIGVNGFFDISPILENYMILGIILLIVSLVPIPANEPPEPWQQFYKDL